MASIVATEGLTGLLRRGGGKAFRALTGRAHPDTARHVAARRREQAGEDCAAVQRRALGNVEGFYWYHTIDLGDGLVTPGDYDFRDRMSEYPFPADMSGQTVLDVGSATGFFAFEFERRGADVVSVELPSIADWDMIWSDRAGRFAG